MVFACINDVYVQLSNGTSWKVTFGCASTASFPTLSIKNVNLVASNSTVGVVYFSGAQDTGSALLQGTYSLSVFGTDWTTPLKYDASVTTIAAALMALPGINNVKVAKEGNQLYSQVIRVGFYYPVMDYPQLQVNWTSLTGANLTV
jgi:hypothetical protein